MSTAPFAQRPFCLPGLVLALLCAAPAARADQALYLQGGEEYHGRVLRTEDGKLHFLTGGEEKVVPLDQVQRIEFQRRRQYDQVTTAQELAQASEVFAKLLEPRTEDLAERFPQADYVVLADRTRVTIEADGRYEVRRLRAWRVLKQSGAGVARRTLGYFPDRQQVTVRYGLTVLPDGSVAHLSDTALKDEALHARLPAYDFRHRLRFTLRGASPGATLILATSLEGEATLLAPLVVDRVLWDDQPALRRSVRIECPEGQRPAVAATNGLEAAGAGLWEVRDTPQLFPEPMMPPHEAFAPRLVVAWPKATWAAIAGAFLERAGGGKDLATRGVPPRGLFDQVRTAIRLEEVPLDHLPDGPAPPDAVLRRGYGNEVERALLLAALLRGAGCEARTVLARGRDEGPLVPAVPRLWGLARAVVRVVQPDGTVLWLQADHDDRAFGELDPEVQGAQGLDLHTGELVDLPVRPAEREAAVRHVEVTLEPDGSAMVRDAYRLRGHYARRVRGLKNLSQAALRTWAARQVGSEVTGVDLLEFHHSDFHRANLEERLRTVYRVPALAEKAGDFLLLRLPNAQEPATSVGRSRRHYELFWEGREREETTFVVRAPEGYQVYALGEGLEAEGEGWSASAAFRGDPEEPGVVRFRDVWERRALSAPKSAYAAYRAARIGRSRLRSEVIVLVRR